MDYNFHLEELDSIQSAKVGRWDGYKLMLKFQYRQAMNLYVKDPLEFRALIEEMIKLLKVMEEKTKKK
jgi:hypothetical protein